MPNVRVSKKGQVTLPAAARRALGILPFSLLELEVRECEIVLRPVRPITAAKGVFHAYAVGKPSDWETIRSTTEAAVAAQVVRKADDE